MPDLDRGYDRRIGVFARLSRVARLDPWTAAGAATAVFVAAVLWRSFVAIVLLVGYSVVNSLGVRFYCERLRERRRSLRAALRVLGVVLVPVGLVTSLLTIRGFTPSEASSSGSLDEGIRSATASTAHGSHHGRGGMP